ncbi:MAG: beta-galactosidase [Candidatus Moduliflexus flocculans]|nr:beta-galactosidase [Candidatus Moduliflexus flocculans]
MPGNDPPAQRVLPQGRPDDDRRLLLPRALARGAVGRATSPTWPELGFEFTHFGEFAWAQLEPSEGRFDFAWLDRAVDLAAAAGLKVILCTPTPCPPAWLGEKHPEIYLVGGDGRRRGARHRANASLANEVFVRYARRIVEELGRRYGRDPRVWGWQLDNEPLAGRPTTARRPGARSRPGSKRRYGTVGRAERGLGRRLLEHGATTRFAQVLIPNETLFGEDALSPHAVLDFRRFTADTQAAFLHGQDDVLRAARAPRAVDHDELHERHRLGRPAADRPPRLPDASRCTPCAACTNLGGLGFRLGRPAPDGHGRRLLPARSRA